MVRSRLRFGAGVCVLAAGLLMGGGAVAVADPVSGGSPNGDDGGTNFPVRGGTASSPVGKITGTLPKTLQDVAHGGPLDENLVFAGHAAYKFKQDPFYSNGFVPTVKQLVDRILTGD